MARIDALVIIDVEEARKQIAERVRILEAWRPRSGSMVNRTTMTAAMIDSRDFIAAKRRADTEVMMPKGAKIAISGGFDFNDHRLIWDRLDKVHAKHPDIVLLHGDAQRGAELRRPAAGLPR